MADNYSFKRYEYKYLMNGRQYEQMRELFDGRMTADSYGLTTIANIYFDTEDYRLVRNSLAKPVYKEKLRLRSYGVPDDDTKVFLEIKKKFDGIVYKRRISLTHREAVNYLFKGIKPEVSPAQRQIFNEIDYFIGFYRPEAKVYIAYDRIAMFGNDDPDLRVTFDTDIRSRTDDIFLSSGDRGEKIFGNEKMYLMETKAAGALPLWLVKCLNETGVVKTSFSKYGTVYEKGLWKTLPVYGNSITVSERYIGSGRLTAAAV